MLFRSEILSGIKNGDITLAFRRWKKPAAKAGGSQMTPVGLVGIREVRVVDASEISEDEALAAGFASLVQCLASLEGTDGSIYRIRLNFCGDDPRIALRLRSDLSDQELLMLAEKLARLDKNAKGKWTTDFLELIAHYPASAAGQLAILAGMEKERFKLLVRKLKALGLTESLAIGYKLSPRGERILKYITPRS